MLVHAQLNGSLINSTLIDSGSSLLIVSTSTLAALPVTSSVQPYTSCTPNNVDIFGSAFHVLNYVDAAVAVSDVEVRQLLVVVNKLTFPLLIGFDILEPYRAITELGPPDVVRCQLDRCTVCVEQREPVAPQRDLATAVVSVLSDATLRPHAASQEPVKLPLKVLGNSTTVVEPLLCGLAFTSCAVPPAVCAPTGAARVLSVVSASNKPINLSIVSPIAAVSSLSPPKPSPHAFSWHASESRRNERLPRRPRGRHRALQRGDTPTSNAVRRRRSPSSSAFY